MYSLLRTRYVEDPFEGGERILKPQDNEGTHDTFAYIPSKFSEENLTVTNVLGHICSPTFLYDRETFNNDLILYVISGTFYVEQYGKKHTLKTGDGILMTLKDHHRYYTDNEDVASFVFFHFRGKVTNDLVSLLSKNNKLPILYHQDDFPNYFYQAFQAFSERSDTFEYDMSAAVYSGFMEICKEHLWQIQKDEQTTRQTDFTDSIIKYVDEHIYEKITLDDMANAVSMSKYHFCRAFSAQFNISPMQYVMNNKLYLAKQVLVGSTYGIDQIAHMFAFSDQSHFSKLFKKKHGISPIQFRKLNARSYLTLADE